MHACIYMDRVYYACINMDRVEQDFLETQELQPLLWLRFNDDIFFIWTHEKGELKKFIEKLITLLLILGLHIKSTDRQQYLHYASSHPEHTKRSVFFSQTLRVSRLWSEENDFKNYKSQIKSWFLKRKYPEKLIENEMRKVKFCKEGMKKG